MAPVISFRGTLKNIAVSVAAVGLVLALPTVASATDDWYDSSNAPNSSYGGGGQSTSTVSGVSQWATMWVDGGYAAMNFGVEDVATDGYCATSQIRYQIWDGGAWSGWHTRNTGVVDCTTDGHSVWKQYVYSNYIVRNMASRACHASSSGAIVECESTWHYV